MRNVVNSVDSKRLTCEDCEVLFHVNKQSLDFASGVHVDTADFDIDEDGQDIMFGYAGDETENVAFLTSSMSTHLVKKLSVAPRTAAQHRSIQSPQQRNHNKPEQQTEQAMQESERRQRGERSKKREGKKG